MDALTTLLAASADPTEEEIVEAFDACATKIGYESPNDGELAWFTDGARWATGARRECVK